MRAEETVKLQLLEGRPDLTEVKIIGFETDHAQIDLVSILHNFSFMQYLHELRRVLVMEVGLFCFNDCL